MKMKNILKRITAVGTAAIMTAGMMGMSVMAATPTINEETPISLTIHKYITEQSGEIGLDSSVTGKEIAIADTYLPLNDVEFSVVKVADIIQYGDNAGTNSVKYELTDAGAGVFGGAAADEKTGLDLNDAVKTKTALELTDFLEDYKGSQAVVSKVTGKDSPVGIAKFEDTDLVDGQGLYLVVETGAPKEVTKRSVPFLVSLPMTDKETMDDWMYNVHAYPKNTTAVTDVEKNIVDVDGAEDGITENQDKAQAQIGDVITYHVPVTAIVPEGGLSKLGITDTMSKGLTFKTENEKAESSDVQVYMGASAVDAKKISENDYTVETEVDASGITTLKVYFTLDYINRAINTGDKNPEFLFVYQTILNENAVIGQTGNTNDVDMYYNYNTNPKPESDIKVDGNETKVFTWGIDLTKTGDDDKLLEDVEFTLKKGDANTGVDMTFSQNTDKAYVPDENSTNTTIKTNADGKLVIRGLKSGSYILTETKTAEGYVLLKDSITIVIEGDEDTGEATATVAGKQVELKEDGTSLTALIPITVVNNTGFDLPKTGEVGTAMFTIVGIILVLVSAFFLLSKKKKTEK